MGERGEESNNLIQVYYLIINIELKLFLVDLY
jgi:hypothetical protein